jgi:hypothetical protein
MDRRSEEHDARFRDLRAAYEDSFRKWSEVVRASQALSKQAFTNERTIHETQVRLEVALNDYRQKRDELVEFVLARSASHIDQNAVEHRQQVEQLANLLWQSAGRPQGTADADWFRAEQMIREAAPPNHGAAA